LLTFSDTCGSLATPTIHPDIRETTALPERLTPGTATVFSTSTPPLPHSRAATWSDLPNRVPISRSWPMRPVAGPRRSTASCMISAPGMILKGPNGRTATTEQISVSDRRVLARRARTPKRHGSRGRTSLSGLTRPVRGPRRSTTPPRAVGRSRWGRREVQVGTRRPRRRADSAGSPAWRLHDSSVVRQVP